MSVKLDTEEQKQIAGSFFDALPPVMGTEPKPDAKPDDTKPDDTKPGSTEPDETKPDDEPIFAREPKKVVTPTESIAILRKQRDEERDKNKIFSEAFGEHKPQVIKPLIDLVSEFAEGPITEESVTNILFEFKESKNKINELETQIQQQEAIISKLDVEHSSDFAKKYKEPYKAAHDALFLEYATVAGDKTIIAPRATEALHKLLVSDTEISGIDVKLALSQFAKAYKAESGEDPQLPSMNSLMNSLRSFKSSRDSMQDAYTNWKDKKQEDEKSLQANQQIQTEAQKRASKKLRVDLVSKAFREFDLDPIPFIDEKEAESLFKEEYTYGEGIFNGTETPTYDNVMQRGVKARLWDKYSSRLKELIDLEESVAKGERNGLTGSHRQAHKSSDKKIDWLGGALR